MLLWTLILCLCYNPARQEWGCNIKTGCDWYWQSYLLLYCWFYVSHYKNKIEFHTSTTQEFSAKAEITVHCPWSSNQISFGKKRFLQSGSHWLNVFTSNFKCPTTKEGEAKSSHLYPKLSSALFFMANLIKTSHTVALEEVGLNCASWEATLVDDKDYEFIVLLSYISDWAPMTKKTHLQCFDNCNYCN